MKLFHLAFCSLFLFVACSSPNNVALDISPNYKANYISTVNVDQEIAVAGTNMSQSMFFEYSLNFHEISGSENMLLKLEYKKIRMKNSNPMLMMDYNSETFDPNDTTAQFNFIGAAMHKLLNRPIDVTITPKGKITDVQGFEVIMDEVVESLLKQFGGMQEVTPEMRAEIRSKMKDVISDENLKSSLQQIFVELPEEKISKDEEWTGEKSTKMSGISLNTQDSYRVVDVKENTVHLDVNSLIKMDADSGIPLNLDGTQIGTMEMDKASGLIKKSELTQNLKGSSAEDANMQMTINSKITSETVEVK